MTATKRIFRSFAAKGDTAEEAAQWALTVMWGRDLVHGRQTEATVIKWEAQRLAHHPLADFLVLILVEAPLDVWRHGKNTRSDTVGRTEDWR